MYSNKTKCFTMYPNMFNQNSPTWNAQGIHFPLTQFDSNHSSCTHYYNTNYFTHLVLPPPLGPLHFPLFHSSVLLFTTLCASSFFIYVVLFFSPLWCFLFPFLVLTMSPKRWNSSITMDHWGRELTIRLFGPLLSPYFMFLPSNFPHS